MDARAASNRSVPFELPVKVVMFVFEAKADSANFRAA
jgi:hypothetical protein